MESIKNVIKDLKNILLDVVRLEKLHKARQEDVEYLEKHVAKLQEQNQKLSSQVEKHLEEKNNGNWAREGAIVWHGKEKMKGVLVYNNKAKLKFVGYRNKILLNFEFNPFMDKIEPYNGQDKEEVEKQRFKKFLEQIEKGDILIKGELVICVLTVFSNEFRFQALTDTCEFKKGETYASGEGNWAKYDANKLKLPF